MVVQRSRIMKNAIKDFYENSSEFLDQPVNLAFVDGNLGWELAENHACHSSLARHGRNRNSPRVNFLFDAITFCAGDDWDIDKAYRYVDFLINRSYMRYSYFDKDPFVVLESGVFVMNTNIHCNYLAHSCVSNRSLSSNWHLLDTWIELVDLGVEENVAIYLSHNLERCEDRWVLRNLSDVHHASRSGLSFTHAKKMFNFPNESSKVHSSNYYNNETYSAITGFFQGGRLSFGNLFYRDAAKIVEFEDLDKTVFSSTDFDSQFASNVVLAAISSKDVLKIAKKIESGVDYGFIEGIFRE